MEGKLPSPARAPAFWVRPPRTAGPPLHALHHRQPSSPPTPLRTPVQYVSDVDNLCLMMNLLKDQSRSIQFEAFHVFKVRWQWGGVDERGRTKQGHIFMACWVAGALGIPCLSLAP